MVCGHGFFVDLVGAVGVYGANAVVGSGVGVGWVVVFDVCVE